jgi:uncharacterized SAM-binding protein YcdF (DUF218 family)
VIVLAGFKHGERAAAGADAWRASGAERIVVSHAGPADARVGEIRRFLRQRGVPEVAIRVVGPTSSTLEEARTAAGLAGRCGWDRVIVVTSPYHTRRAGFLFRRALGEGVEVTVIATDEPFHSGLWWAHAGDTRAVLSEWAKGVVALRYLFGRPQPEDPGPAAC